MSTLPESTVAAPEPGTVARMDRQALHQVLANLVDNAQQHGAPGAVPILAAGRDDRSRCVPLGAGHRGGDRGGHLLRLPAHPRAALGQPMKTDLLFTGSVNTQNRDGQADLNIGLTGPKRKARLLVVGQKTAGVWTYSTMRVEPQGKEPIDLVPTGEPPPPETPSKE